MAFLRNANGCSDLVRLDHLADVDRNDGSNVTIASWTNCASGAPVVLYRIDGAIPMKPKTGFARPMAPNGVNGN
jgi:hypothetical protein